MPRPSALIWAARCRCPCGASLAYDPAARAPAWGCSAVLLGQAVDDPAVHAGPRPLAFNHIRARRQARSRSP